MKLIKLTYFAATVFYTTLLVTFLCLASCKVYERYEIKRQSAAMLDHPNLNKH